MVTLPERQTSFAFFVVPSEELVEELRSESSLVVERQGTATVLVHVDIVDPYSEQRIWYQEEPWDCTPRLDEVQKACKEQRQSNAPSKIPARCPCVSWPDDTVIVSIKEEAVLLQNLFRTGQHGQRSQDLSV